MKYLLISLLFAISATLSLADDHTADQINAATDFAISGLKLGMTLDQANALGYILKPNAAHSDAEGNITAFSIENAPNVDLVIVEFFNNTVSEIYTFYLSSTMDKIGGWGTLYDRLTAKLGPSDEAEGDARRAHEANWQFYSANRLFVLSLTSSGSGEIDIVDKDAARKIGALKASKAKVGF